jgi:hypothetical protein
MAAIRGNELRGYTQENFTQFLLSIGRGDTVAIRGGTSREGKN